VLKIGFQHRSSLVFRRDGIVMVTRISAEIGAACATAAFGIVIVVGALEFGIGWGTGGPEPGAFPFYIGILIAGASLATVIQSVAGRADLQGQILGFVEATRVVSFIGPVVLFLAVAMALGLYVGTALYLFAVMWLQGRYRVAIAASLSVGVAVFFYLVLDVGFQVPMLKGPLEAAIGLD